MTSQEERARLAKNARQRRYVKRNYKQALEYHREWRDANREHYREWYRDYYARNKARIAATKRAYQQRRRAKA